MTDNPDNHRLKSTRCITR